MTYVTAWTAMTHTVFISAMTVIKELLTVHPGHVSVQPVLLQTTEMSSVHPQKNKH